MFALVDCNNFYCSCERVFDPGLVGRPVVVLSNNDGCVIARSDEAKQIGIVMGTPEHMARQLINTHRVAVFSSNYTLYGDMSDRVMKILATFVPRLELYSIDEAFLDLSQLMNVDLLRLGMTVRKTVTQHTGIPVTVGIAPTKTLAKMANDYSKKHHKDIGVHWLANDKLIQQVLSATPVGDIWGIGHQHANFLLRHGFKTAADFANAPENWVRTQFHVVGLRTWTELRGTACLDWEYEPKKKKNICISRAFGKMTSDKELIAEALSNHAAAVAFKLRKEKNCARKIGVFIETSIFRSQDQQYLHSIDIEADVATNDTAEMIRYAMKGLDIIFRSGFNYMKCGIIASDFTPEESVQHSMFDETNRERNKAVMNTIDKVNASLGRDIVRFAAQGFEKKWKLKAQYLSRKYTTNIDDVLHVKI
jgi:DNA polymerase V